MVVKSYVCVCVSRLRAVCSNSPLFTHKVAVEMHNAMLGGRLGDPGHSNPLPLWIHSRPQIPSQPDPEERSVGLCSGSGPWIRPTLQRTPRRPRDLETLLYSESRLCRKRGRRPQGGGAQGLTLQRVRRVAMVHVAMVRGTLLWCVVRCYGVLHVAMVCGRYLRCYGVLYVAMVCCTLLWCVVRCHGK